MMLVLLAFTRQRRIWQNGVACDPGICGSNSLTAESTASIPASGPRRRRRLWPVVLLAAWMFLSWNWWRECVLLLPIARIPQAATSMFAQYAPTGEVLFMSPIPSKDLSRPPTYRGPVEFWSLQTGRKTGEKFTSDDFIECLANHPRLLTVIRRHDERWVADLASGQLLHRLPDAPAERRLCHAAGPGRVVYRVGKQLVCFDYLKQETVWTLDRLTVLRDVGDRYAVVMRPLGNSSNSNIADLSLIHI